LRFRRGDGSGFRPPPAPAASRSGSCASTKGRERCLASSLRSTAVLQGGGGVGLGGQLFPRLLPRRLATEPRQRHRGGGRQHQQPQPAGGTAIGPQSARGGGGSPGRFLQAPLCPGAGRHRLGACSATSGRRKATAMKPLGDAFIKLVKMIIAPVIFLTVVTGIAGMSDLGKVGRVAGKAIALLPLLLDPGADRRPDRRQCRPAGRRHEHRPGHARQPRRSQGYAAKAHETDGRRLPDEHHPGDHRGRVRRRRHPAGAVLLDAVRRRPGDGRRARRSRCSTSCSADGADLQAGRHPDEGRADRRLRRHGLHHRQVRHRLGRQPGRPGRHLLPDLADLRAGRAGRGGALQRLLDPVA
jgi:hypothetical protein